MLKNEKSILLICSFIFVVILSAFFRLQNLDVIEFKADEGVNLFLASRPIFGHPFPPIAIISSAGIPNPPFFNYLLFPIVYVTLDPKTISFVIGSINSLAIGLLFLLVYRYYGFLTALFSATLIALSPWSILFSRKIWPPDFILPFMVGILLAVHKIAKDEKDFFWLPYTVLSLFLIQLYHPTIFFVFLTTVFLLTQKVKIHFRYVGIGIILGIIPLMPYLSYAIQNSCEGCSAFLKIKEKLSVQYSVEMFLRPLQAVGQGHFQFILGNDMVTFAAKYPFIYEFRKLLYIPYLLLPVGMIIFWKKYTKFRFFVYATISTPVVYFFIRLEPFMHYFAVIFPILFIFLGVVLAGLFSIKNLFVKFFTSLLFIIIVATLFSFNTAFFDLLKDQKSLAGDYGTSFSQLEKSTKDRFKKHTKDKNYKEMIIASFVQRNTIAESPTLAKAVYNLEETEKNMDKLDQRLEEMPIDSSVENELLAYYTVLPKNAESMEILRDKTIKKKYYRNIYEEIYGHYLSINLKNAYRGSEFSIEYPRHWKKTDLLLGGVKLSVNDFFMVIVRDDPGYKDLTKLMQNTSMPEVSYDIQTVIILDQEIQRIECLTLNAKWCGVKYGIIVIKQVPYLAFYQTSLDESQLPDANDEKLNFVTREMDKVILSLREENL